MPKKKPRQKVRQTQELPTPEQLARGGYRRVPTEQAGVYALFNETQTPLDRYVKRNEITRRQYDAGVIFHGDWMRARLEPRVVSQYSDYVSAGSIRGALDTLLAAKEAAYQNWRRALEAVGPVGQPELVVCCCEAQPVGRGRLEILRRALEALADFYGLHP